MESVKTRVAQADDQARAIDALTLAFVADPIMRWAFPEAQEYLEHFPKLVRAFGGRAFTHDTAVVLENFAGAALWIPPGFKSDGDAVEAVFREHASEAAQRDVFDVLEQMDLHHPKDPHWYLAFIGVDHGLQSRGFGSTLIQHTLARADADGLPAYLESCNPANIPFYQRNGFEIVKEMRSGDSPPVIAMFRHPR